MENYQNVEILKMAMSVAQTMGTGAVQWENVVEIYMRMHSMVTNPYGVIEKDLKDI